MLRALLVLVATAPLAVPAHATVRVGAVATEHALAADAGATVLRAGGSAVDAAIAAATAICVVHASSCGPGGGSFALVHRADGQSVALDARERAPQEATLDRFRTDGRPDPSLLRQGGLAVGVPGEVAGIVALHRRFGTLPLSAVLAPAVRLAREGFVLGDAPHLLRQIERSRELLAADPGLRAVFLGDDGALPGPDFRVVQRDLADTLEAIATDGGERFYRGATAAAIVSAVRTRGGVISPEDLAAYRPVWRRPLTGHFQGRRIVTFPPPGSGGIVLEALGILAGDDLVALGRGATGLHLLAGAMAQAFTDRARWYGDPAFSTVPVARLLAPSRLAALRARLSTTRIPEPQAAIVPDAGTAHVSVVDRDGNAAAITTTINTSFGAGILVPGTGVILNNEMDDFALDPSVPNVYGLLGSEANALAPEKRPQSSMSPTIVLAGDRPELVVGGSGGPTIISGTLQVVLGVTAFGQSLRDAVDAPRIHHQGVPPFLLAEKLVPPPVRAALERIGHQVRAVPAIGAVSAVGLRADGTPVAAGDRRKDGGEVVVGPTSD